MTSKTITDQLIADLQKLGFIFTLELSDDKNGEYLFLCAESKNDGVKLWLTREKGFIVEVYPLNEMEEIVQILCRDPLEVCNVFKCVIAYQTIIVSEAVAQII